MRYEALYKEDRLAYEAVHDAYEIRGRTIPNGSHVELTLWAIQNGLGRKEHYGVKVRDCKNGLIRVRLNGNQTPTNYWPGFWKITGSK